MSTSNPIRKKKNPMPKFLRKLMQNPSFAKIFFKTQAFVFKNTKGLFMSTITGYPICVVTMTGAKTGKLRSIPIMYVPYKEGVLIVASKGGADDHPSWYWNLRSNPEVEVILKGDKFKSEAKRITDEDKDLLWPLICDAFPNYKKYQEATERNIPVFNCQPST
ncbi:MAG: nitroreductase family deazaflavin-dependent oxidoreductase [SAR86 cluster bacterium]|jgi:F420H(2)-dependent quinone reductase|nr:nitroreductase family deazaflavin-dependent oxidoreductase [SAR86 cluster bacterium]